MSRRRNVRRLPLDGGWGWAVVAGCALMHILVAGLSRSYGVIYIQLQQRFSSSAGLTAGVGGMCTALRMGLSPFGTSLSNRFGTRPVMFMGGLLIGAGCLLCAFAPSTEFMFLSYGFLTGVGGTLAYAPSLVLVSQYFNKYRSIAVGLGSAGSGIGVFSLPPLMNAMFDYYGYMGTFIIFSAIMLNVCICGALHRPLEANNSPEVKQFVRSDLENDGENDSSNLEIGTIGPSQVDVQDTCEESENIVTNRTDQDDTITKAIITSEKNVPDLSHVSIHNGENIETVVIKFEDSKFSKKSGYCENLSKYIDLSLCLDPVFIAFIFGMGFYTMSYMAGQMLIPALGQSLGHSKVHSVFLLSILGIADTVSRTSSGFIFDVPALKPYRRVMFLLALIIAGSCNFLWAIVQSYTALVLTCVLHGLFNGCMVSQRATLLSDLLGVEKLSSSLGLTVFIQGCGIMVGPVVAGFLRDMTGAYTWSYVFTGIMAMVGAVLFFLSSNYHRCCRYTQ